MTIDIRPPATRAELEACFPVMRQLRPHLTNAVKLAERVKRQAAEAYPLLAAWRGDAVVDLAGYRMPENLLHGRFCYVDDIVVEAAERTQRARRQAAGRGGG